MSSRSTWAPVALLAFTVGVGGACNRSKGATTGTGQIIFSHSRHLAQGECADCHPGVAEAGPGTEGRFIPGKPKCGECHEEVEGGKCAMCHRGAREGVALKRVDRKLRFPHAGAAHKAKGCAHCHPADKSGGATLPGHDTCNAAGCHRQTFQTQDCARCHQDLTRFVRANKTLPQLGHGPGFARAHGIQARQNVRACLGCHDQTFCADCHSAGAMAKASVTFPEKIERRFIHRGDYVGRHMVEARSDPQSCRKCHGPQHCRSCHALNGLAQATPNSAAAGRAGSTHPAGWMTAGAGSFHGRAARQDISRCASCHDRGAASNCVGCHRVGGTGGNPHPTGWSWRDKAGQCRNVSMCATCHEGGRGCR